MDAYTTHQLANGDVRVFWPETCDVLTVDAAMLKLAADQGAYVAQQAAAFAADAATRFNRAA